MIYFLLLQLEGESLLKDGVSLENVNTKLRLLSSFPRLIGLPKTTSREGPIFHTVIIDKHYKQENAPPRESRAVPPVAYL